MNNKYPVIKCNKNIWKEIKPILKNLGIKEFYISDDTWRSKYVYLVSNFGRPVSTTFKIGNIICTRNEIINNKYRYVVNTIDKFIRDVAKIVGKEYNNEEIMKRVNLVEKLKYCKKGTKLYSPIYGDVEFLSVDKSTVFIKVLDYDNMAFTKTFNEYGMYNDFPHGECLLYPSKENRDWDDFKILEKGHKVMCSDLGKDWCLRYYNDDHQVYDSNNDKTCWEYIVPIEFFDFGVSDLSVNIEQSL